MTDNLVQHFVLRFSSLQTSEIWKITMEILDTSIAEVGQKPAGQVNLTQAKSLRAWKNSDQTF